MGNNLNREINEAIVTAEQALKDLHEAQKYLDSAKNWGIYDMLGGGFISTMIKHNKMNDAERKMNDAKISLGQLSQEINDVYQYIDVDFNVSDFVSFADYFFDGVIADWLVQNRIHDARNQVKDAIQKVEYIITQLERYQA